MAGRPFPACHPLCSPRTFRSTRNMPNVQIPQVMQEFITRGVWAIQEWEPDQGPDLERSSLGWPERAQVALSEIHMEEGRTGRHGWCSHRQMAHSDLLLLLSLLGKRQQTTSWVAEMRVAMDLCVHLLFRCNSEWSPVGYQKSGSLHNLMNGHSSYHRPASGSFSSVIRLSQLFS